MIRVDQSTFLRFWAGTSMMPALLVWGMRHGSFDDMSEPMEVDEIAEQTGYSRSQIAAMIYAIEHMMVVEADNEVPDIGGDRLY